MKKRATALMLAIMMAFSMMPNIAFAEGIELASRVSVNTIATESGETVDYYVAIPEGSTIAALDFTITYDADELTYVSSEKYGQFFAYINANVAGTIDYSAADVAALAAGDICKITFKANDDLIADCTSSISAEVTVAADANDDDVSGVSIPAKTVNITVTNPAKLEVTSKKILVGGDHTDGTIGFKTVKLPDLAAGDITVTASPEGVLEFGETSLESGSGSVPFTVKSGAAAGEVTVTVKAGSFSDTCTVFVDKPAVEGDLNVGSTLTAKSELAGATFKWIVILGEGADMQNFERSTGASYTLVEADKGGVVMLEVSHPDYEGMDYVYAHPILGAKPAAPTVELASSTLNSITLKAIEGAEYSIDGGETWQDSPTFNDLEVGKEYTISVRMKAVAAESPAGAIATVKVSTKGYEAQEVKVTLSFFDKDGNSSVKADWYNYITVTGAENNKLFITGTGEKAFTVAVKDNANYYFNSGDFLSDIQTNINSTVSGSGMNLQLLDPTKPGEISIILYEKQEVVISAADSEDNDITGTEVKVSYKEEGFKVGTDAKLAVEPNGLGVVIEHVWKDAEGNAIEGDPVNVGTYKLYASAKGGSTWKAAAEKEMFTLVIEKVDRTDVPKTPTLVSKTENSLTVKNDEAGVEWMLYNRGGGTSLTDWMKGENGQVTFEGLTDGTRYQIYARYADNGNQNASDACAEPLVAETVYTPKTIKIFGYVTSPEERIPGLFKVYLADEDDNPTNVELTTITAGESNAKRVVIMLTEEARENYYLNSYPGGVPSRFETSMSGTGLKSLNAYSFATTLTGHDDGVYLPEDDELKPRFDIRLIEKKENTFLVSKNGAAAATAPVEETASYTGSPITAQGALQASADAVFTVIPNITDSGMAAPTVCWKDANGEVVANPVNVGTYYLYAALEAGTMWKATPETLVLTLTVEKGEQAAPEKAPEKVTATKDSVTVKLADAKKVQFAIDDGTGSLTWYDAASDGTYTITGLDDYTKYNVVARYAANDNQLASPASAALAVQTEPAPQIIGVKVKCGGTELAPADFKVYEGSEFFDWAITGGEEVTITVKLSDEAKKIYKPNQLTVDALNIGRKDISCSSGEYTATVFLTNYTHGGTITFNLAEKETFEIRVCKGQKKFSDMQKSLTDTREYDGKEVGYLETNLSSTSLDDDFFEEIGLVYSIKNNTKDVHPISISTYWVDAQGTELSDDPVNIGTYKLIAKFDGNEKYKPIAETVFITLTITPVVMETPAAPTVGEVTEDSISYTGVAGQKYIVTTSATAPAADAEGWKDCTADGTMTENGLEPNTQYYIHTFVPALSANHTDSAVATTAVTTAHSYGLEVAEEITLTWNVRVGTDLTEIADMIKPAPIKSTGTGQVYVKCLNTEFELFCPGITIVTLSTDMAKMQLNFWPASTNSTAAAGKVEETFTYEVRKNGSTGELIKTFTVKCVLNVLEKNVVTFTDFADTTVTYGETYNMETAKPQVQSGVAPYTGALDYTYTDANGVSSTVAPTAAGTYTVKVAVPADNADYAGEATATLTIKQKEIELTGLAVKEKVYDGTTAAELDTANAKLKGIVGQDEVTFSISNAAFNSKNVDSATEVTYTASISGADVNNYTLKAVEAIAATIKPCEVEIAVTAEDKVYDGTVAAVVKAAYVSGMIGTDEQFLTLKAENGTFADKNVGEGKIVTFTVVFENNGSEAIASNYTPKYNTETTASIAAKEVYVTFEGTMEHVYDGQPKSVTAKVEGVEAGDEASVTVVYGTDTAAPTLAGAYVLTAKDLTNSNYKLAAEPYTQAEAARTLKIALGEYTPGSSSAEKSIGYLDTAEKSYDLKEIFGVELDGTFEVFLLEENDILAKHELVSGNALVQLKGDCSIGQTANITYVFTPAAANTYKTFTVKLTVKVAAETVKSIEIIGAPDEIEIGTELDLSAISLKVTFENNKTVTFTKGQYAVSGYSTELKEENLGTQALTLTVNANGTEFSASKNITVKDALTGLSLESAPSKTEYALGETKIDLAGGKVKAIYKSGAEKSMDLTDPALTLSEVTETMMRTLGEHAVAVSYTEGSTFQTTFTFTVVTGSVENPGEGQTGGTVKDDDEFLTDPDDENSTVPGSDVNVTIGAAQDPDGAKEAVEAENPGLKDKNLPLGAKLEDASGNKVYSKQPITVQVAYPAGTDSKDTFIVYLVNEDGSTTSITPTKEDKHLSFELPAGFSEGDFVIAWKKYVKPTNKDEYDEESGSFEKRQRNFWKNVRNLMRDAKEGSVLTIGAGDYDQMPTFIMDAVKEYNVGLRIRWNGGEEILLAPENALTPEKNRLYYPLSYLEKNLGKVQLGAGGSIILAPQTGDDRPVTDYNMGFFTMPGAVAESVENASGEVALAAANGSMNGAPILMLLGSAAALAAGWFVSNRRREEEN